jgi:drug/metabolite transporter (DMT)-like permease
MPGAEYSSDIKYGSSGMPIQALGLITISVLLTASAQLLMKSGMSSIAVQNALSSHSLLVASLTIMTSPFVLLGLLSFAISAALWLLVLSQIEVSQAYPFVALGIAITAVAAHFLFGEHVGVLRALGISFIFAGVIVVAAS